MECAPLLILALILLISWIFLRWKKNPLKDLGVAYEEPLPVVGNILPLILKRDTIINLVANQCKKFSNENIIGTFGWFGSYSLTLKHPSLIKQIAIKEFDNFVNRSSVENSQSHDDLLGRSVLLLKNQEWKDMRAMLSPLYTSSKIKYMFGLLIESAEEFIHHHEQKVTENSGVMEVDAHDLFTRATVDGIFSTLLGFKSDTITNETSEAYKICEQMAKDHVLMFTKKHKFHPEVREFFKSSVINEISRRKEGKIVRPDVIQLLLQILEGQLKLETGDAEELSYHGTKLQKIYNWSDDDLISQAFAFFLGSFDTTSMLLQALSHELINNPEYQETLAQEVDEMLKKLNGKSISYEQIHQMKFLELVVQEGLRKWPSFRMNGRVCSKETILYDEETGKSYKIEKGVEVFIPVAYLLRDPRFFPDPEKFDPYRFSQERKHEIISGSYLPFGQGPRSCIGSRYAIMEAKLLLFYLISKFSIERSSKTPEKVNYTAGNTGFREKVFVNLRLR